MATVSNIFLVKVLQRHYEIARTEDGGAIVYDDPRLTIIESRVELRMGECEGGARLGNNSWRIRDFS